MITVTGNVPHHNASGLKRPRSGSLDGHEYKDVTSESYPFESLCWELQLRILSKIDIPELLQFGQASKFCNDIASHDDVWRLKAIQVGCPMKDGVPVVGQVMSFFKELKKSDAIF